MTSKQILKAIIENRNNFLFSINHTILGYAEAINMVDKIEAVMVFFQEKLPGYKMEPNWDPDPETYDAGTIWLNIYFNDDDDKRHEVARADSDLCKEYRTRFPKESNRIRPYVMFNE